MYGMTLYFCACLWSNALLCLALRWHLKKNHGVIFKEFEAQKATMRSSKANPMRTLTERQKKMIERDAQSSKGETKSVVDEGESLEVERVSMSFAVYGRRRQTLVSIHILIRI
jgi:hypothetical protein